MTHQKILTWVHPSGQRWLAQPPAGTTGPDRCGVFQVTSARKDDRQGATAFTLDSRSELTSGAQIG